MNRHEAADNLIAAIHAHAVAHGNVPADSMLDSFVVVVHWVPIEQNGTNGYSMHYATEEMPRHMVLGLLQVGSEILDEEDD